MATTPSPRSIRRRTSNRQAAFSFLSTIQLDPVQAGANTIPEENPSPQQCPQEPMHPFPVEGQGQPSDTFSSPSSKDLASLVHTRPGSTPELKRAPGHYKKDELATTFLSGLSLNGGQPHPEETLLVETTAASHQAVDMERDWTRPQQTEYLRQDAIHRIRTESAHASRVVDLSSHQPVQRSTSTPSFTTGWTRNQGIRSPDSSENLPSNRQRKTPASGHGIPIGGRSTSRSSSVVKKDTPGMLSTLFAHDKDRGSFTSSDMVSSLVPRHGFNRGSSRWLAPLKDHVHIRPLLSSGKAHIVKKIFRRPSFSIPKHMTSHALSSNAVDRAGGPRVSSCHDISPNTSRRRLSREDQRHIIYSGTDLTKSCVSLGENLSQHAIIFTTKHGSPLIVSSIIRYNDDSAPSKRRRRRFDREYLQQITKEALIRRKANSFAHLLTQSNALDPEPQEAYAYDPYYLDDPELKTGKNRTVISLACYMGSVIQYTRPSDLKRELNEHFRSRHPTIDPSITLSKIRKVKTDLLAISEELDLEISTAALAYAYFEKLILKGSGKSKETGVLSTESSSSPITKENRKLMACVCLLLAYKVNEPKRPSGEYGALMKQMTKHMDVSAKDIKEHEFQVFSLLEFNLYLPRQEFLPHFEQILYRQDYINVQEYLGEDEFYSVAPQPRKAE